MNDDLGLFKSKMGADVEPLKPAEKVRLKKQPDDSPGVEERRRAAVEDASGEQKTGLSLDYIEQVEPHTILSYVRPGIQHGVFKKLRLGKYQLDARLDLHRMTVAQAQAAILQFVRDCIEHDVRCGLITHGKGQGRAQPAVLKSCVATWLPQLEEVLAMHSAQSQHGGTGATYVLLRKSDSKRQANWERHIGRRGQG